MKESYGTTWTAERPRPRILGQTLAGNDGKLWNNSDGIDAQATEIGPNISWECGKAMEQPGRHRCPGHRDWAKLMLGIMDSYGTTGKAERPRAPSLGQTEVGDDGKLWNNLVGGEVQATEIGPNLSWK